VGCDKIQFSLPFLGGGLSLRMAAENLRIIFSLNDDRRFVRQDVVGAESEGYRQTGRTTETVKPLRDLLARLPSEADAYGMLGEVLQEIGKRHQAMRVYRKGARNQDLPVQARMAFAEKLRALKGTSP